ncbi:ERAD-associated E3 ubiquitin-protein ligase HRD1 [Trypanosoma brucei equiperdum]|uniref:ERAD-associated E3 ubiquitin-protein ligase HRD1 n=1 Tax=Trypanosoma brucei equiperdum TaxID=630700 RepID=A0A3L6L487_9TRYP|nr:ERAD-associated E3 ubiquitin-protein ligase HRD1 [Trypanosoma brucei equiperdum]
MLSLYAYIFLSLVVTIGFVVDYATVYTDFFSLVVALTDSPIFRLLCVNSFIALSWVLWLVARFTFFGTLSRTESDAVRSVTPVYAMEFIVCPLYFGISTLSSAGVVSLVTVVVAVLHRLAQERVSTLQVMEDRVLRTPMLVRLLIFLYLFSMIDLYVVFDMIGNTAESYGDQLSMQYCIALLYVQFLISILKSFTQLFFTVATKESTYNSLAFYMEMFFSLSNNVVFFISFLYICTSSYVPFPLMRMFLQNMIMCGKNVRLVARYRKLTALLREIPNATEEILSRDPHCAICYDDMSADQTCKQLPCGHCYHEACLLHWFEKMSTCPYCRSDIAQRTSAMAAYAKRVRVPADATTTPSEQTGSDASATPSPEDDTTSMPMPSEEEMRRSYERYLAEMASRQQAKGAAISAEADASRLGEEVSAASTDRLSVVEEINKSLTQSNAVRSVDVPAVSTKEAQRLAAYEEHAAAVRAAQEKLQQRLKSIDAS